MSRLMLDSIAQAVVAVDLQGVVTYWNAAAETCFGWTAEDAIGRSVTELTAQEMSEADAFAVFDSLLAGRSWRGEFELLRRDGSRFPALIVESGVYDDEGTLVGIIGVTTDLTELKAAEVAAQEQVAREARWRAIVFQSADGALITDPDTFAITYASPAITRLFGWQPDELVGRPGAALVHPEDIGSIREAWRIIGEDPNAHPTVEFRLLCADGSYRWVEETVSNLCHEPGVGGVVGNLRDITERRDAMLAQQRRERMTKALAAKASDVALIMGPDGLVKYANPSASRLFVASEGETLGKSIFPHIHPDDRDAFNAAMTEIRQPGASVRLTYRRLGVDASWRWVEHIVTNCLDDPDIEGLVVNLREITEQVEAEQALRASELRYRLIAETAQEGILTTDVDGRILYANQTMADLLGRPLSELYTLSAYDLVPVELQHHIPQREQALATTGAQCFDMPYVRPDGVRRVMRVSASALRVESGRVGSLAMVSDVTDALAAEADLQYRVFHDPLTGLGNRALLVDKLGSSSSAHRGAGKSVAVLLADVDQFKLVNDSLGHASGDELLIAVAQRWKQVLRPSDLLARLGGDEFVVLCENCTEADALLVAERLQAALNEPIQISGRPVAVGASIGIAVREPDDAESADALLGHADAAMYEAKRRGRGRSAVFTRDLVERAETRLRLVNDLKAAIEHDKLRLHYQPIIDLSTGRLQGIEALCRWPDEQRGEVSPEDFIPAAEESGLIQPLDRWVLRQACRDAAALRAAGVLPDDAYVTVNSSAHNLAHPDFEADVCSALTDADLPATALVLEVTESAVMRDPGSAEAMLGRFHEVGVRIAIDDFGTGYSSLAYLRRFPIAMLKIDRSFVHNITTSHSDLSIVGTIVDLAHALGVLTVCEGIETEAQLRLLESIGCEAGQGWFWSKAVEVAELNSALRELTGPAAPAAPAGLVPLPSPAASRRRYSVAPRASSALTCASDVAPKSS
jgi:diguanylate cyclase (GGDEF)-like protein/PAS domain S-box-containing protein